VNFIETALDQIESGDFQSGLDTIWAEIDTGSDEARVALANKHTEVGLYYFAEDQWAYLLESESTYFDEASFGRFGNAIWMRKYEQAARILDTNPGLKEQHANYLANSYRDFCTLSIDPTEFAELVGQLVRDSQPASSWLSKSPTLNSLLETMNVREHLFNIACDLAFNPSVIHSQIAVSTPVAGTLGVSRAALEVVGSPMQRADELLTTIASLIAAYSEMPSYSEDPKFLEITRKGKAIANKLLLILDDGDLTDETSQAIGNVCWALGQSRDVNERFAGYVLGGVTND
jgi:hypothetical protein